MCPQEGAVFESALLILRTEWAIAFPTEVFEVGCGIIVEVLCSRVLLLCLCLEFGDVVHGSEGYLCQWVRTVQLVQHELLHVTVVGSTAFLAEPIEMGTEFVLLLDVVYDLLMGMATEDVAHQVIAIVVLGILVIFQDGLDAVEGAPVFLDERILCETL